MLKEAVEAYPRDALGVFVVWMPMLGSDNEKTAREAATMFADARVKQFYDANRLGGVAYSRDMFHARLGEAIEALPAGRLRDHLVRGRDVKPEQSPMWDAALFYSAGVEWGDTAPRPDRWSMQLTDFPEPREGGVTGKFWVDTLERRVLDSDWFVEVRRLTAGVMGKKPAGKAAVPERRVARSSAGPDRSRVAGATNAPPKPRLGIMTTPHAKGQEMTILGTIAGMPAEKAGVREGDVVTKVNGKPVVELTDDQLSNEWSTTDTVKLEVRRGSETIHLELDLAQDENESPVEPSAKSTAPIEVTSLAKSLEPLERRFNADKAKVRFIALLSPT